MGTPSFDAAFLQCLKDGVYPGPTAINIRLGKGPSKYLNGGKYTRRRRELMREHNIPFQSNSPYGNAGEIPALEANINYLRENQ